MARPRRLNIQGLARADAGMMRCMKPSSDKHVFVSCDLASGEPTVVSHFSQDPRYRYACFDGVGKMPYYDNDAVLMISDIYLMTMSVSPIGAEKMRSAFNQQYEGKSFAEQWLINADVCKKPIKKDRDIHKMLKLAIDYGMGPKKMVTQCYDRGVVIPFPTAKRFHQKTWETFAGVRRFADYCALKVKRDGYLINPFGYRLTPTPFRAFNYMIQSSVSGIIHVLIAKLFAIAPYSTLVTIIHDELIIDVPINRIEDLRRDVQSAADSLNEDLKWTVNIRVGFAIGATLYEAK